MPLLDIRHLSTHFKTPQGIVRAVDDVSLAVAEQFALLESWFSLENSRHSRAA